MHVSRSVRSTATGIAVCLIAACASGGHSLPVPPQSGGAAQQTQHHYLPSIRLATIARSRSAATGARPARQPSWISPDINAGRRLVYLSNFLGGAVYVFDSKGALIGLIGGLTYPSGLYVDAAHELWVTNTYASQVLVYARGATAPSTTLNDANELPVDATICPDGAAYVSNLSAYSSSSPGDIAVYRKGGTKPSRTLSYPGQGWNYFLTCDAAGNVFTTIAFGSGGAVIEYPHGKQAGAKNLNIPLEFPGGIKLDAAGNLLVDDQQAGTVTEYTEAGTPTGKSITVGSGSSNDVVDIAVAVGSREIVLGADAVQNQATGFVFPSGAVAQVYQAPVGPSGDETDGVAYDPGQRGK